MNGSWTMARRNLSRNKRRNVATGVAIALGFAALLALGGYVYRVQNYLRVYTIYATRVGHITIYKENGLERYSIKPKLYSLDEQDLDAIRGVVSTLEDVELSGPQLIGSGLVGNGCRTFPFIATGIDPEIDRALREHPEMQHWAPKMTDYIKGRGVWNYPPEVGAVALADGLARYLHKTHVHDELPPDQKPVIVTDCNGPDAKDKIAADTNVQLAAGTWSGMMSALDGEVVAQFNTGVTETSGAAIMTSLSHLRKLYDTPNATLYSIWLKDPSRLNTIMDVLKIRLKQAGVKFELYPWTDEAVAPMYSGTMQFLYVMVGFITVVLATVIIFSVFNSATMTVIERSQEIGMMRSLGYTRRQIRRLFVLEMLQLSALSVAVGAVIGTAGIYGVNHAGIQFNPPGIAGGMTLQLVPSSAIAAAATLMIFTLSVATTLVAVRTIVKQGIATLLLGTQR